MQSDGSGARMQVCVCVRVCVCGCGVGGKGCQRCRGEWGEGSQMQDARVDVRVGGR